MVFIVTDCYCLVLICLHIFLFRFLMCVKLSVNCLFVWFVFVYTIYLCHYIGLYCDIMIVF